MPRSPHTHTRYTFPKGSFDATPAPPTPPSPRPAVSCYRRESSARRTFHSELPDGDEDEMWRGCELRDGEFRQSKAVPPETGNIGWWQPYTTACLLIS